MNPEYYNQNLDVNDLFYINDDGIVCCEEWRDVFNYEGHYKDSNLGRVKSLKKGKQKIMMLQTNIHGYKSVCLCKNGTVKSFAVHLLLGRSFLNYDAFDNKKYVVDHINNIQTDNRLSNLQVTTIRINSTKDKKNKTSKYPGVSWYHYTKKWTASIVYNGKRIHLGYFKEEDDAYEFYKFALKSIEEGTKIKTYLAEFSSIHKGVSFHKQTNKWRAFVNKNGKTKHLGFFDKESQAVMAVKNNS